MSEGERHNVDQAEERRLQDWRESASDIEARALELFKTAIGWALFSLKTAILINGAAAIAVLSFLASLVNAPGGAGAPYIQHISPSLLSFSFGVFMGALAGGVAYLGDLLGFTTYMNPWQRYEALHGEGVPPDRPIREKIARVFAWIAVVAWALSIFLFLQGMTGAYCGLQAANKQPPNWVCRVSDLF